MSKERVLKSFLLGSVIWPSLAVCAYAQDQEVSAASDEDIVVATGIRRSLEDAIDRKRNAAQIIDSISAEDIQKLPDENAARALSRVTGVQITQRNGVGSEIQLRGLSQVFVSLNNTSFVGTPSQQSARDAVRRNFVLDDIPTELFAGFDVLKTPTADNIEGGIGGAVNLRTRAPLDLEDTTIGYSLNGTYGEFSGNLDPRGSLLLGKKFDDKFGVYVNASYNENTTRNDNILWGNWGFIRHNPFDPAFGETPPGGRFFSAGSDGEFSSANLGQVFENGSVPFGDPAFFNADQAAGACTPFCWVNSQINEGFDPILLFNNGNEVAPIIAPQQIEARIVENNRETIGLNGSAQYKPSEDLDLRFDAFYTEFEEVSNSNELRLNTQGDNFNTAVLFSPRSIVNSQNQILDPVVSQDFTLLRGGFLPSVFNDNGFPVRQAGVVGFRDAQTLNLRANANWNISDRFNGNFNISFGENTFNSIFLQQELRAGSGNTNGAFNGGNRRPDVLGNSPALVPPPRFGYDITPGTGPAGDVFVLPSVTDRDNYILAFSSLFEDIFETEEFALQADFDYDLNDVGWTKLEFGGRFADRENTRRVRRGIGQNFEPRCNGLGTEGINDLDSCIAAGGSFLTADRIGVDPFRELQDVTAGQFDVTGLIEESLTLAGGNNGGLFQGIDGDLERVFLSGNPEVYSDPIRDLNNVFGIRPESDPSNDYDVNEETFAAYAKVNFETGKWSGNVGSRLVNTKVTSVGFQAAAGAQQQFLFSQIFDNYDRSEASESYTDFLPSLNVRYNVNDDLVLRFGAARVISRPNLTDLAPGTFIRSLVDRTAIAGDPGLDPFRATNLDFSAEYYIGDSGLLNAAVFYKDVDSFITTQTTVEDLTDGFGNQSPFTVISPLNGEAEVRGFELGYQQPLDFLPGLLDGLGFLANYTFADSTSADGFGLPELSKHSYNLIGYYEKGPLSTRLAYNWRDDRLFRANGFGNNPEFIKSFGVLDYSLSYDLNDKVALNFEVQNITKENLEAFTTIEERRLSFTQFDRIFSFGVRGTF